MAGIIIAGWDPQEGGQVRPSRTRFVCLFVHLSVCPGAHILVGVCV